MKWREAMGVAEILCKFDHKSRHDNIGYPPPFFLSPCRPTTYYLSLNRQFPKKAVYIRQSSVLAFFWLLSIFREMVRSKCYATL